MNIVALSHGYPPVWNMGGEVSLHRTMAALRGNKFVLTKTDKPYSFENVNAIPIDTSDVLDIYADPNPIAEQLRQLNANVVIGQNELSLPAVLAAQKVGAISIVNIHTPPKYGRTVNESMRFADYAVYNTTVAAREWGEPDAPVIHPPISPLPDHLLTNGNAYTLLSSLLNKGVEVVLELAKRHPDQRFIIVRSPAEPTHGLKDIEARVAKLPNVELRPRVAPEEVVNYLKETRILLVPSRYETYGMSAIEAAGYGIPCVHVDTPHVREGIGEAAILVPPLNVDATDKAIKAIEKDYESYSSNARLRAEFLDHRQDLELEIFADFIENIKKPPSTHRYKAKRLAAKRRFR